MSGHELTLKQMRIISKKYGFKFEVSFIRWENAERLYNLETENLYYTLINYEELYIIFDNLVYDCVSVNFL